MDEWKVCSYGMILSCHMSLCGEHVLNYVVFWLLIHFLSMCTNNILNNIRTIKHNIAIWQIHRLLLSHSITRDTLPMNVGTHLGNTWTIQSLHGYTHVFTPQAHANASPDLMSSSSSPSLKWKVHIIPPKTQAYNSLTLSFAKVVTPPMHPTKKK